MQAAKARWILIVALLMGTAAMPRRVLAQGAADGAGSNAAVSARSGETHGQDLLLAQSGSAEPDGAAVAESAGISQAKDQEQQEEKQDQMAPLQRAMDKARREALPETGSVLPLLSVIGFGVLVGGIASAMKTRS